jgi:hypothetical protein
MNFGYQRARYVADALLGYAIYRPASGRGGAGEAAGASEEGEDKAAEAMEGEDKAAEAMEGESSPRR